MPEHMELAHAHGQTFVVTGMPRKGHVRSAWVAKTLVCIFLTKVCQGYYVLFPAR